ncbi:MAG TPA: hypothetical protein VJJ23_05620 [Candidatus Nanoarchaeia archaeon]|nr:hypothetical protein [Candidatus Nanoarchaeia archaeon]
MKKESLRKLLIVTAYAIAMGFFEAAVVIYLRNLFYPNGFNFPLKGFIEPYILSVEWIREIATIIMLITIGMLAGKKFYEKIAYFVYSFAIWDIFYYVFLKMYLNWPSSLLTWDILFMVPWPWVGPVLAPLLCTILMIITTFIIINFEDKGIKVKVKLTEWILVIIGMIIILFTWMYDYGMLIFNNGFAKDFFTLATNPRFIEVVDNYIPSYFNWPLFLLGLFVSSLGVLLFYIRMKKGKRSR